VIVAVAVVAVLEVVGRGRSRVVVPLLLDDAAEAVEAGVLVAAVAGAAGRDVGQVDVGLGMGALDDGPQPEVRVTFQSSRVVRERRKTADRGVHASVVIIVEHVPVGIGNTRQPAIVPQEDF
jgi:hypothetical protein